MKNLDELLSIMARLRDPEGGCPWDLDQDFASISPHTIEEAYEVDEAIASGDLESLRDELGDLLFQVVFQARIAEEMGAFDFAGVIDAIVAKLVRRHPHIFADAEMPSSVEGQRLNWEEIKAAERAEAGRTGDGPPDPFTGIPRRLPALARSAKVAGRLERLAPAAAAERDSLNQIEGCTERARALVSAPDRAASAAAAALVGEALHSWADLARRLGVDPEQALRAFDDTIIERTRADQPPG